MLFHFNPMRHRSLALILSAIALALLVGALGLYTYNRMVIGDAVNQMKEALTRKFHDPESARLRNVRLQEYGGTISNRLLHFRYYTDGMSFADAVSWALLYRRQEDRILCGEVNAKNTYGAYVGYKPFYVFLSFYAQEKEEMTSVSIAHEKSAEEGVEKMCAISRGEVVYEEH